MSEEQAPTTQQPANQEPQSFDWKGSLPEEYRNNPVIAQTKDLSSLASQAINAQSEIGKLRTQIGQLEGGVKLPGNDATDEEWNALFAKLGRPEKPDGYGFEKPELPAEVQYNENLDKWFAEAAHKSNLLPKQAAALREAWNQMVPEFHNKQMEERFRMGEETLKQEFGEGYKDEVAKSLHVLKENSEESDWQGLAREIDESMLTYNPRLVKALSKIFKENYSESSVMSGATPAGQTLQDIEKEYESFLKEHGRKVVLNDGSPEHIEAKKKYNELNKKVVAARLAARQ